MKDEGTTNRNICSNIFFYQLPETVSFIGKTMNATAMKKNISKSH